MTLHANIKVEHWVAATLGAARIILPLTTAAKPHPFKMCAFLCLAGYSLSQILIISVLHVAQFMQIRSDFIGKCCCAGFRKPLGDDILPKRKDYESFDAEY